MNLSGKAVIILDGQREKISIDNTSDRYWTI